MTASCMGSWKCRKRETCVWHQSEDRSDPNEKLCEPGQYGAYIAINLHKVVTPELAPPGEPEQDPELPKLKNHPTSSRIAQIALLITPDGIDTKEITAAMGFKTRSRTAVLMRQMVAEGLAVAYGSGNTSLRYFPDEASRDVYAVAYRAEMAERRRTGHVQASRRYRGTEMGSPRQRTADVEAARQQRDTAAKKSTVVRRKKETKAASALVFKSGTDVARPKKVAWADIPLHNPNGIKPVELSCTLRDRFAPDDGVCSVISSAHARPWAMAARP